MRVRQGRVRRNRRLKEPFARRAKRFLFRSFKIILAAAVLPALVYAGWRGYREAVTTPYLAIEAINVEGARRVSKEEVVELSGIAAGENIYSFRARDAARNIKQNPWILKAEVRRGLPDTVTIEVAEREPFALVKLDAVYVMDSTGVVFKKLSGEDELDLPVITGLTMEGLDEDRGGLQAGAIRLVKELRAREGFNLNRVSEIHVDPTFGLSVYTLDDGVRLDLGKDGFEAKLSLFEKVLQARGGLLNGIESMDLNGSRGVVVRYSTNVVKEGGDRHGQKG